jgi:hypothetical protein
MPARIVTSTYRYKRPPRKRKAVPLEVPAIVTVSDKKRLAKADRPATVAVGSDAAPSGSGVDTPRSQTAAVTPRSAIGTVKRRSSRFGDVPDLTPEEQRRRGDTADAMFREMVRRAASKD